MVLYNVGMRNIEIAALFNRIADLLQIQGANPFRVRAYQRAAASLEGLTDNIEAVVSRGATREIPGIGEDLASKISEFAATGRIQFYEDLKKEVPLGLLQIVAIPSVGPKTAKKIYDRFHVKDLDHLDALARSGKLLNVPGFKQKSIDNIIHGIEIARRQRGNHLLGRTLPIATRLCQYLEPHADRVAYGGSLRRMKEIVHDVDILAASSNPEATKAAFLAMPFVVDVLAQGPTKCSVRLEDDLQVDLRVIEPKSWGAALHYFTGSKAHNIRMRERAIPNGIQAQRIRTLRFHGQLDCRDRRNGRI